MPMPLVTGDVSETRKLAAILVSDVVGYSRLAGADEDRILARLRTLRSDLIDPTIALHHGRVVKRTGDGSLIEFRSVVDAVRCAIEVQNGRPPGNWRLSSDYHYGRRRQRRAPSETRGLSQQIRVNMSTGSSRAAWGTTCLRKPHRPLPKRSSTSPKSD
jgi:class 3 adenylate cyclase